MTLDTRDAAWTVGDRLGPLVAGPADRTTLALFAGASGDHNPIHLDVELARSTGLDDVFAQGMLTMAYLGRLVTDRFAPEDLREFDVRFAAITPVNARPVCTAEVTAADAAQITLELRAELADGTVTVTGRAVISRKDTQA